MVCARVECSGYFGVRAVSPEPFRVTRLTCRLGKSWSQYQQCLTAFNVRRFAEVKINCVCTWAHVHRAGLSIDSVWLGAQQWLGSVRFPVSCFASAKSASAGDVLPSSRPLRWYCNSSERKRCCSNQRTKLEDRWPTATPWCARSKAGPLTQSFESSDGNYLDRDPAAAWTESISVDDSWLCWNSRREFRTSWLTSWTSVRGQRFFKWRQRPRFRCRRLLASNSWLSSRFAGQQNNHDGCTCQIKNTFEDLDRGDGSSTRKVWFLNQCLNNSRHASARWWWHRRPWVTKVDRDRRASLASKGFACRFCLTT